MKCLASLCLMLLLPALPALGAESTAVSGKLYCPVTRVETLPFTGIVESVDVTPGKQVKKDEALVRYVLEEKAAITLEKELAWGANTEELRGQIVDLERQVLALRGDITTSRQLVSSKLGSRSTLQQQEETLAALNRRIHLLREAVGKQEEVHKLRLTELETIFNQPIKGKKLSNELTVISPMDGYVLSVAEQAQAGALLNANTVLAEIGSMDPMLVRVQVFENEAVKLKVGAGAVVRIPSLQDREYPGKISQIAWTPQTLQPDSPSYYNVQLEVPNADLALKQGLKALVRFTDSAASGK